MLWRKTALKLPHNSQYHQLSMWDIFRPTKVLWPSLSAPPPVWDFLRFPTMPLDNMHIITGHGLVCACRITVISWFTVFFSSTECELLLQAASCPGAALHSGLFPLVWSQKLVPVIQGADTEPNISDVCLLSRITGWNSTSASRRRPRELLTEERFTGPEPHLNCPFNESVQL